MQQSTYVSLNTQAMKLKLNSGTLKAKTDKLQNDCQEVFDNFKLQENHITQLDQHESKGSRDFYSLVYSAERNLGDVHRRNECLAKKLAKLEIATSKLVEQKAKLSAKYDTAVSSIKAEEQKANLYDFTEYSAYLQALNSNYDYIIGNIALVKDNIAKNNSYYDSLQTSLSSFNIDKLKKDTANNIEKATKNVEALRSIYSNTSEESKKEIADFLPTIELNISNFNQKATMLFAFIQAKDSSSLAEIAAVSTNSKKKVQDDAVLKLVS